MKESSIDRAYDILWALYAPNRDDEDMVITTTDVENNTVEVDIKVKDLLDIINRIDTLYER